MTPPTLSPETCERCVTVSDGTRYLCSLHRPAPVVEVVELGTWDRLPELPSRPLARQPYSSLGSGVAPAGEHVAALARREPSRASGVARVAVPLGMEPEAFLAFLRRYGPGREMRVVEGGNEVEVG